MNADQKYMNTGFQRKTSTNNGFSFSNGPRGEIQVILCRFLRWS